MMRRDVHPFGRLSTTSTTSTISTDRAPSTLKRFGTKKILSGHDEAGRRVPSEMEEVDSEGVRQDDVWEIGRVPPIKQLFPTEKPLALLERIITASSREGDLVLDPFCGRGTTVTAGFYESKMWNRRYPKIQLLAGKAIDMPPVRQMGVTFKKATKSTHGGADQLALSEQKE